MYSSFEILKKDYRICLCNDLGKPPTDKQKPRRRSDSGSHLSKEELEQEKQRIREVNHSCEYTCTNNWNTTSTSIPIISNIEWQSLFVMI